jgi:hypothetical protein
MEYPFVFLKPQPKKRLNNIMKNMVLNVIGLSKFRLPLEEADVLKKVI